MPTGNENRRPEIAADAVAAFGMHEKPPHRATGWAGSQRSEPPATDESFNGKLRDECLSLEWFRTRQEAVAIIETWRRHYNEVRPHSSLGDLTPIEFKREMLSTTNPQPEEAVSL